ncbi:MAG: MaoC family dehydratase [Gammaproteobacteria bacterium]|nr:MaoC family dehydratase [Gammaproteobacteria bacterium]
MRKIVPLRELKDYVGQDLGCSEWLRIDQARIDAFAEVSDDRQFVHVDPERAGKTFFGSTIAHGFLTLSLLTHLTSDLGVVPEGMTMGINYGFDKVRFLQPVKVNDEIRACSKLLDVTEKQTGHVLLKSAVTIEIRGETRPALVAEWLGLVVTS